MAILVINCGSSSVKFALFRKDGEEVAASGIVERIGTPEIRATLREKRTGRVIEVPPEADHAVSLKKVFKELGDIEIAAVGHRVVHGGPNFSQPVLVDDSVLQEIRGLAPLAPSHAIPNALGIEAAKSVFPDIPHVAVFDTAFHQTMAPEVFRYAIPQVYYEKYRVRRYGAHGTSHAWVAARAAEELGLAEDGHRLITAHLGYGCSVAAVVNGRSVDTSMGLTPLEGLVMGTRSGNVDPNLHAFLAREAGLDFEDISRLLNHESGLLGLSGISGDMRELTEAHHAGNDAATLALRVFVFRLAREIGGLLVSLGGEADGLVFTGGIGENSALIRDWTVSRLSHLGFSVDQEKNERSLRGVISPEGHRPAVLVIPTNEERAIAAATMRVAGTT